ncbi:MAG: hypothetical protein OEY23_16795 [Acidimicrobiia bacterium]|nr:hypothetical protein [Acidimicrobiia bacterium]
MQGSIRQRWPGSWELRVYTGTDPESGRRRDRTLTVRGNRTDAERPLRDLIDTVSNRARTAEDCTLAELL